MKYRIPSIALAAFVTIGCSETQRDPTDAFTPTFDGASGCYSVKFNIKITPAGMGGEGQITGDLEGSVITAFDPASLRFVGATLMNGGTYSWSITGGVVPGLGEFETQFENINILVDRPGSRFGSEHNAKHRALSGVKKANLTAHGTFRPVPTPLVDQDYNGVICP
jgi:hypothetical protein